MSKKDEMSALTSGVTVALKHRSRELKQHLPKPSDGKYIYQETNLSQSTWSWLTSHGLVEKETHLTSDDDYPEYGTGNNNTFTWRTPEETWELVLEYHPKEVGHPCEEDGHGGLRNLGGGEYTCRRDSCDRTFGRDVAKRIVEEM